MLTKKNILDNLTLLNSLVYFLPVSFIMGNLAININILCIGLVGIVIYGPSIFNLNNRVLEFLLYGFFFLYNFNYADKKFTKFRYECFI